jgi:hypothetical protein
MTARNNQKTAKNCGRVVHTPAGSAKQERRAANRRAVPVCDRALYHTRGGGHNAPPNTPEQEKKKEIKKKC